MENITSKPSFPLSYGMIHVHSDKSVLDSPAKIGDICDTAKKMGVKGLTLTDHGFCTGWVEFYNACKKRGIKPIPGVEAYVKTEYAEHAHMLLIAKNYAGYQDISRAVTAAQSNIDYGAKVARSAMTKEIIEKYLGNGNVIATSACAGGILACAYRANSVPMGAIAKRQAYIEKYESQPGFLDAVEAHRQRMDIDEEIERLKREKDGLSPVAQQSFRKREMGLRYITDERERDSAKASIENDKAACAAAKERTAVLNESIKALRAEKTRLKAVIGKYDTAIKNCEIKRREIRDIESKLLTPEEINAAVDSEIEWLKSVFGGDFYIEMQYHGIPEEAEIMPYLAQAAEVHGVPLVAANDSHMTTPKQAKARQLLLSLRFEKWKPESVGDSELYMKSDAELSAWLSKILPPYAVQEAMSNVRKIIDMCNVDIPADTHYPMYRDAVHQYTNEEAVTRLYELVNIGIEKKFTKEGKEFTAEHVERMKTELNVIVSMGFAHYFLIVEDIIRTAKSWSPCGVGPGRGSAAGSLVAYVLDIVALDPLVYGLLFERFLNPERVSMPDIDMDFSAKTRKPSIERLIELCGADQIARIHTNMQIGAKESIHSTARAIGYRLFPEDDGEGRSHVRSIGDAIAKSLPDKVKTLADYADKLREEFVDKCPSNNEPDKATAKEIIESAVLIEGCTKSYSMHAGGVVISDGHPISDYVPLMYTKEDKGKGENGDSIEGMQELAVQCDMTELEGTLHLLKMDFLGLNTLNYIDECVYRIERNTGQRLDPYRLPFEKAVFTEILGKGDTAYVFQLESYGMRKMLVSFKPTCFEDIILLLAAYRPGPMEFIPDIIKVKRGEMKPSYIVPQMESILAPTYGYPIYQEQLMEIFRCAGFSGGEADVIRRLMSKKKKQEFLKYKGKFVSGMIALGADEKSALDFWESLVSFAEYAFNKSHAAMYAIISYATAYFKYYYKKEYMCSVLNFPAKIEHMPAILLECRKMGIPLYPPDINASMYEYTEYRDGIRVGLKKYIKGMSASEASAILAERKANGAFRSLEDFHMRCKVQQSTAKLLTDAGAFDNLCCDYERPTIHCLNEKYADVANRIRGKREEIERLSAQNNAVNETAGKKPAKRTDAVRSIEKAQRELASFIDELRVIENTPSDKGDTTVDRGEILDRERSVLMAFVSAHPLDEYANLCNSPYIKKIGSAEDGSGTFVGMVLNLQIKKRKKDKKEMAFFDLEDKTGIISVACFADTYEKYGQCIRDDAIIKISGKVKSEKREQATGGDGIFEESETRQLVAYKVELCRKKKPSIVIAIPYSGFFEDCIAPYLGAYESEDGRPVLLYNGQTGTMEEFDKKYSEGIFFCKMPGLAVMSTR